MPQFQNTKLLWEMTGFEDASSSEHSLTDVVELLKKSLLCKKPGFCLWLKGDLGAGKTTLTGLLLHALGLDPKIPVLSPTFTYLTEYVLPQGKVFHVDLYRLVEGDTDSLETIFSAELPWGKIVEWPERAEGSELITPDYILEIRHEKTPTSRRYALYEVSENKA